MYSRYTTCLHTRPAFARLNTLLSNVEIHVRLYLLMLSILKLGSDLRSSLTRTASHQPAALWMLSVEPTVFVIAFLFDLMHTFYYLIRKYARDYFPVQVANSSSVHLTKCVPSTRWSVPLV